MGSTSMPYVVVVGNVGDGFKVYGPNDGGVFDNPREAADWVDDQGFDEDWVILPVLTR